MLRFESPWCLLALLAPAVLWAWRWWHRRRRAGLRFSSVAQAARTGQSWRQRFRWLPTALGDVALVLLAVCLARPQAGRERVHDVSEGIAIEMLLDRSGSMQQEMEFEGRHMTRLAVVKEVFRRFVFGDGKSLDGRVNDLVGMIVFARYADTTCPLTLSHGVLQPFLDSVALATEAEDGTAIGEALALGVARLHTADQTLAKQLKKKVDDYRIQSKVIILLTDGENNFGRSVSSIADLAVQCGVRVHVVGITGDGVMVVQTPFGERRMPVRQQPIDTRELEEVARKTGGTFQMAATASRLLEIYQEIDRMERSKVESVRFVDYQELFQPLALTALGLVVLRLVLEASLFRKLP